jgi:hypothetical protein
VSETTDVSAYCREIETYLCRKNEGHLIRIVGPAFEQVCGWAARGVPLKVAFHGIDRYCERYYGKGPRRRPVRIEFCETDILETFDDWRRAVGIAANVGTAEKSSRKASLASHLERVINRLTALRGGNGRSTSFWELVDAAIRELDALKADAHRARGERRTAIAGRLEQIDRDLLTAAAAGIEPAQADVLRRDARAELEPFADRMAPATYTAAVDAAFTRLVRDALGLPIVSYE